MLPSFVFTMGAYMYSMTTIKIFIIVIGVLDDVATIEIGGGQIETDKINDKLIYFVKGDDGSAVALQGDRGPSGARGLKGDSGDIGPIGSLGPTG